MSCCRSVAAHMVVSPPRLVQTIDCGVATDPNDKGRNKSSDRKGMEDDYVTLLNHQDSYSFFGVFDGHGGAQVANYAKTRFPEVFFQKLAGALPDETELDRAWHESYSTVDEDVRTKLADPDAECAGSTSTTVFVTPEHDGWLLSVGNLGDSKAMLYSTQGGACRIITGTHRPGNPDEAARVKDAGGWFSGEKAKRLNGRLAITRALGDHFIKKTTKGLIATPSVSTLHVLVPSVLVIASDGLWDFAEEEVKRYLYSEPDIINANPQQMAQTFLDMAVRQNSNDNIAVVVVVLAQKLVSDNESSSASRQHHSVQHMRVL